MPAASYIAVAALAVQGHQQAERAKKAEDIQEEKAGVERAIQQDSAARSRRAEIRKRLVATGEIENVAAQTGGTGGTAATQSVASVTAQSAANIGAINRKVESQNIMTDLQEDLFKANQPGTLEQVAGVTAKGASIFV